MLEAFYGQVHLPMAGNHDDFRIGIYVLYLAQKFNAVHARNFNIDEHDSRFELSENT